MPFEVRDRLIHDAGHATRRCRPVTKLSLLVKGHDETFCCGVMNNSIWTTDGGRSLMNSLLLDVPALRHIPELRVGFDVVDRERELIVLYNLDPAVLPGHTLRVLDLTRCTLDVPPGAAAISLPRLSALRLHKCSSPMKDLQGLIHAAPSLGSLHVEDLFCGNMSRADRFVLHCPSVTTLALAPALGTRHAIEIDAPCLRSFNFQHAKAIKLKVPSIEGMAVDKDAEHEHLATFHGLERLELDGPSHPGHRDEAAAAIASLPQCCPVIHDFHIRMIAETWGYRTRFADESGAVPLSDLDVSMDLFERRYSKEMAPLMLLDRDDGFSQVADLPGLTGCRFNCLQNHLKNVKLQFELKGWDSFEVCLAKFFAENCKVLKVLQIDDGKLNYLSHINWMVHRWRANALEQRKRIGRDSTHASEQRGERK
ncbi:hypothetical protein BRADI_5g09051v3, partial [Brachypodium distachyon]